MFLANRVNPHAHVAIVLYFFILIKMNYLSLLMLND